MDIINRLHTTFRDCLYFEFGEGYVKFYDQESKKYYQITIQEYQPKGNSQMCAQTEAQGLIEIKKTNSRRLKDKKTWQSILKEKNK